MNKSAWVAWAIKNSVSVICFTALAIYFGKWWIVLFGYFFLSTLETKRIPTQSRVCDGCGKTISSEEVNTINDKAKSAGWIRKKNGNKWEDYCPECQKKMYKDTFYI